MFRIVAMCLALCCWIDGSAMDAWATNTGFLPGDAFFHTLLDADDLDRLATEESPSFRYRLPRHVEPNLCGYAGFWELKYEGMPEPLRQNLIKLALHLRTTDYGVQIERIVNRETGELEEVELNPIHLFIYEATDHGFDALKCNEHWYRHTTTFDTFVPVVETVAHEWRISERVPPLAIEAPFELVGGIKAEDAEQWSNNGLFKGYDPSVHPMGGSRIEEPVVIRGSKPCVVVPTDGYTYNLGGEQLKPQREFIDIARGRNRATYYVVTADGIVGYRVKQGDWIEFDPFQRGEAPPSPPSQIAP